MNKSTDKRVNCTGSGRIGQRWRATRAAATALYEEAVIQPLFLFGKAKSDKLNAGKCTYQGQYREEKHQPE